jgi:hypothetical protein
VTAVWTLLINIHYSKDNKTAAFSFGKAESRTFGNCLEVKIFCKKDFGSSQHYNCIFTILIVHRNKGSLLKYCRNSISVK